MNYYTLKSHNHNYYIYSGYRQLFLLSNPALNKVIEYFRQGREPNDIIKHGLECENSSFEFEEFEREELMYNIGFFYYLKENDFFKQKVERLEGKITPLMIKNELANISRIVFEITNACNLDCFYCAYGNLYDDYEDRNNSNISFEKSKVLLNYIFNLHRSNKNISTCSKLEIGFYGGEPFLNLNFMKKIIEYINKNKPDFLDVIYSTTTNGTLLEKNMDFIVTNNFRVWVSIDGDLSNNEFRVYKKNKKETFSKVHDNILSLKNKYPEYFKDKVDFQAVLHSKNTPIEIYEFIKSNYDKAPIIAELSKVGLKNSCIKCFNAIYKDKEKEFSKITKQSILNDLFSTLPNVKKLSETIEKLTPFVVNYMELTKERTKQYIPTGTCIPFSIELFMTVSGKILPCEHIGQQFSLATVTSNKIEIDYNDIALKYETWFSQIKMLCRKCERKSICTKCIFKLIGKDNKINMCDDFMDFKKFKCFLEEQISVMENNPEFYHKITSEVVKKNI